MPIRAITFDADDTIWDFQTVAATACQRVVDRLLGTYPDLGHDVTVERFLAIHESVKASRPPGTSYALMRRDAIRDFVTATAGEDVRLSDELGDLFFSVRDAEVKTFPDVEPTLDRIRRELGPDVTLGIVTNGNTTWSAMEIADRFDFWLAADQIGIRKPDPRIFHMTANAAACRPRELVHVGDETSSDIVGAQAVGARGVFIDRRQIGRNGVTPDAEITNLDELVDLIHTWNAEEMENVGVGPHPRPWPIDERLDPQLLAEGDRRNVVDRFRYWRREAIVAELDKTRRSFHVAVENWQHDLNIGSVVRNANAFGAGSVHIIGKRRWNRRGAMVTDRYQHIHHHESIEGLVSWANERGLPIVGVDNLPGSVPLEETSLPRHCVLLFGQESTGISDDARRKLDTTVSIAQFGSTRSINAAVASGIAMHSWIRQHD